MKSTKLFGIILIALLFNGCGTMLSINIRPTGAPDSIRQTRTNRANLIVNEKVYYTPDAIVFRDRYAYITFEPFSYDNWFVSKAELYEDGHLIGTFGIPHYGSIEVENLHDNTEHTYTLLVYFTNTKILLDERGQLVSYQHECPAPVISQIKIYHYSTYH